MTQWEVVNLDRFAMGDSDGETDTLQEFEGIYHSSRNIKREDGTFALLHRVENEAMGEIEIWGCDAIDRTLVFFPPKTPIRLEYRDKIAIKDGRQQYKRIRVMCAAGTVRLPEDSPNIQGQYDGEKQADLFDK